MAKKVYIPPKINEYFASIPAHAMACGDGSGATATCSNGNYVRNPYPCDVGTGVNETTCGVGPIPMV
jgi:hypothetical protein